MTGRRQARELAMQFLFQRDFNQGELDPDLVQFWKDRKASAQTRGFAEELIRGVELRLPELDRRLAAYAENWDVRRMGAVDRAVMRVCLYEMLFCTDIPPVVSINEAVDIARDFSGGESGRFVNGILDRARKDLDRPARTAVPRGIINGRKPD